MKDLIKKLTDSGLRVTKPRLTVLRYLKEQDNLISARELHNKIKIIDQATVYRVLNSFEDLGLVIVEILEKEKLYCLADHPHHHIICKKCGYAEEFECSEKEFKTFKNFTNIKHHLTLMGVCNKCNS